MQRLAEKDRRDAQPRLFAQIALHSIAQNRGVARGKLQFIAPFVVQNLSGLLAGIGSGRIDHLNPVLPPTRELLHLFFQRHARQQVGHPVLNREARVPIARRIDGLGWLFLAVAPYGVDVQAEQKHDNERQTGIASWIDHGYFRFLLSFPKLSAIHGNTPERTTRITLEWFLAAAWYHCAGQAGLCLSHRLHRSFAD